MRLPAGEKFSLDQVSHCKLAWEEVVNQEKVDLSKPVSEPWISKVPLWFDDAAEVDALPLLNSCSTLRALSKMRMLGPAQQRRREVGSERRTETRPGKSAASAIAVFSTTSQSLNWRPVVP